MNQKKPQSKRTPKKTPKIRPPVDSNHWTAMLNPDAHRFFPGVDQLRERLIYTLLEWARDPDHLDTTQFLSEYYIPPRRMNEWIQRYPDVKEAWEQARLLLAGHRRVGSMKRKLDPKSCFRDIYRYDPSEAEVDERAAKLKNFNDDEKGGNITINVLDKTPEIITQDQLKKDHDARN